MPAVKTNQGNRNEITNSMYNEVDKVDMELYLENHKKIMQMFNSKTKEV